MSNADYRKSRGTDKPFSGTEEQTKVIWSEYTRKRAYQYKAPEAAPQTPPKA